MKKTALFLALVACAGSLRADVKLPAIISSDMVLAKSAKTPLWGWADPGEAVVITLDGKTARTTAGADGRWHTELDLSASAPGPFELVVQGKNRIAIPNVAVGEVWVASGQSNMELQLRSTDGGAQEALDSANPQVRQFILERAASMTPLDDCKGRWLLAGPKTSPEFSAVGYYFSKKLQSTLGSPVGVINTTWGGTPSESWTSAEGLDSDASFKAARQRMLDDIESHPARQSAWVDAFEAWLKAGAREDRPSADPASLAAPDISTEGWTTIMLPGTIKPDGVTGTGAIWVRRTINISAGKAGVAQPLLLGALRGYESIYWNGELVKQLTPRTHPGVGFLRLDDTYTIPGDKVKAGANVLAIRVYAPVEPARFPTRPQVGGVNQEGEWLFKTEFPLPAMSAAERASLPAQQDAPLEPKQIAASLYSGMIHPLVGYGISGVIWYQGENNAGRGYEYRTAFRLLINDWRRAWGRADLPFYFCQLANWKPKRPLPSESDWAELRESQSAALALPNTGQAALIDLGESHDIHPRNKKDVGERLALIALAKTYGRDLVFSGPVYQSMKIEGGRIRIQLKNTKTGLVARALPATYPETINKNLYLPLERNSPQSELEGFAICGADRKWVWADAKIDGDTVVVWSDQVPAPVAVRYAWADNPTCNLYNAAGLPAFPFRTDDFPAITGDVQYCATKE